MFTTLSTTRSATSGIELSVSADGAALAWFMPGRNAAPVPTSPTTAATARRGRSGFILVPRWSTNLGPDDRLPLFRDNAHLISWDHPPPDGIILTTRRIPSLP